MTIPDCPIVQSAVRVRAETRRDETRRDDARHGATRAMTRASPRKRASENDREAANATRRRPVPPRGRAPPLTPSDIEALNKAGKKTPRPRSMGSESARFKKAPFRAVGTVSNEFLHTSFHETRTHGVQANWSLVRTLVCASRRRCWFASNVCGARARVTDDYARRR